MLYPYTLVFSRSHSGVRMTWIGVYSVGKILRHVNGNDIPFGFLGNTVITDDMCLALTDSSSGMPAITNSDSGLSSVTEHLYPCNHTSVFAGICMKNKLGKYICNVNKLHSRENFMNI